MKNVLIADDHDIVRKGLVQALTEQLGDFKVGEAADSRSLLKAAAGSGWDLIILDIRLPGRSGLDLLPDLRKLQPETPILIISAYSEEDYGVKAYKLGAKGFIHKSFLTEELPLALPKLLSGASYVSPSLSALIVDSLHEKAVDPHHLLSPREFEVLQHIALGHDVHDISEALSLSENTVATYRSRIYKKLRLKNNVEVARYAMKFGLVD